MYVALILGFLAKSNVMKVPLSGTNFAHESRFNRGNLSRDS